MDKIANRDCRSAVENKKEFNGSNLFARWHGNVYVVYSYGEHYPMFLWINPAALGAWDYGDVGWHENSDKFSTSTAKHHSQARPLESEAIQHGSTKDLNNLISRYIVD
jgi:hypothetical protein